MIHFNTNGTNKKLLIAGGLAPNLELSNYAAQPILMQCPYPFKVCRVDYG
jgi:hypothetical protein